MTTTYIMLTSDPTSKAQPWRLAVDNQGEVLAEHSSDQDAWGLDCFVTCTHPQRLALTLEEFLANPSRAIGHCPRVHVTDSDPGTYLAPVDTVTVIRDMVIPTSERYNHNID